MTSGFSGVDGEGASIQIFLDIVGYIGDYPEVTDKKDVLGHNANCPCHLCCFRKFKGPTLEGSAFCMQTDAHSNESAFLRCAARTEAIRSCNYSATDLNNIGLKATTGTCAETSPLFALSEEQRKKARRSLRRPLSMVFLLWTPFSIRIGPVSYHQIIFWLKHNIYCFQATDERKIEEFC